MGIIYSLDCVTLMRGEAPLSHACTQESVYSDSNFVEIKRLMRTMSRYSYCSRTKGEGKMYTCKDNLIPLLYSGKKIN